MCPAMRGGAVLSVVTLVCAGVLPAEQAANVAAEITRLTTSVPEVVPESSRGGITSRLDRARKALASGQTYLALYDLQAVFEAEAGYRLASIEKTVPDHAAFTRKWTEMGAPAGPPAGRARLLFIEALAQSAEGRAPATYRASLPYAQDAGIAAGLYYLGESHAMVRFAALCRALDARGDGRTPALPAIEPALAAYEKNVVEAYAAAPAAQRPQYAGVNVAIKLARTLDEQGRREGALLQYLVSRFRHALIVSTASAAAVDSLKERVRRTTIPPGLDHSIGEFFLQLASATLEGPEPSAGSASAVLDDVLPAYLAVVGK